MTNSLADNAILRGIAFDGREETVDFARIKIAGVGIAASHRGDLDSAVIEPALLTHSVASDNAPVDQGLDDQAVYENAPNASATIQSAVHECAVDEFFFLERDISERHHNYTVHSWVEESKMTQVLGAL